MSNGAPITASGKPSTAVAIRIERQRIRLFRALNFVAVTSRALDQDDFIMERDVLKAAFDIINDVALELNAISGHSGPLPEDIEEEAS